MLLGKILFVTELKITKSTYLFNYGIEYSVKEIIEAKKVCLDCKYNVFHE